MKLEIVDQVDAESTAFCLIPGEAYLNPAPNVVSPVLQFPACIEYLEGELLKQPQIECRLEHRFSKDCYVREVTMPAGTFVMGHCHKTRHFNFVMSGRAIVSIDGQFELIEAGAIFESQPGVRKVLWILEEMKWATVHVTPERDLDKLRELLIEPSETFLAAQAEDRKALEAYVKTLTT